jgi:hypothetical protein
VTVPVVQTLLVQVPEGHTTPQAPQLDAFEVVSMQLAGVPHSIWPAVAHVQTPPPQFDPPPHTEQLLPQ